MSTDSNYDKKRHEESMKSTIIEEIASRLDELGYISDWSQRKVALKSLTMERLHQLTAKVNQSKTAKEAMEGIVKAICDYKQVQQKEDNKRLDNLAGPAKMSPPDEF
ncbi:MAG: hypothetical protein ABSG67_08030 [Thermoguttaceae bacterium]